MTDWEALAAFGLSLDGASGFLIALLGVGILLLARRGRVEDPLLVVGLAVLLASWGLFLAGRNLSDMLPRPIVEVAYAGALLILPASLVVALRFPRPLRRPAPTLLPVVGGYALVYGFGVSIFGAPALSLIDLAYLSESAGLGILLLMLAARAARDPGESIPAAFASVAFAPYIGLSTGVWAAQVATGVVPFAWTAALPASIFTVALAAIWLVVSHRGDAATARLGRNLALLILSTASLGLLFALATDPLHADNLGIIGLARILSAGVLGWAILRRDLLGLDVGMRWTISRGTIAAVFIAVFFVASETAQTFFAGSIGPYVGILAAGALVFAIAPLQRVAERLAASAVPVAEAPRGGAGGERGATAYRLAVRAALADGALTLDEERTLAELAEHLGIGPVRALELRSEVAASLRPEAP